MRRVRVLRFGLTVLTLTLLRAGVPAAERPAPDNRTAPETWDLWRCGPLPFPETMTPRVPEAVAGAAIEFGQAGADLVIVMPEHIASDYNGRALQAMVRLIRAKVPGAALVSATALTFELRSRHLLVVGTLGDNPFAREVLGEGTTTFLEGIAAGGYRLRTVENPFRPGRKVILALGADTAGAWAVAGLLAYAIHPEREGLTDLKPWPVRLPAGIYWTTFEARCASRGDAVPLPPVPTPAPSAPRVPFGVRVWGSPMPTLGSFQRLVGALHPLGINTIAIQGGGWPDLPDAANRYRTAVELAWREGIFTIVYVGNEMAAHRPAPLTANHRAVVMATKDLPGLLEWHLYNQLSATLSPAERQMVEEQMRWLTGVSRKRVGVEIVWGHDTVAIPPDKVRLIEDLRNWGMGVVAHDDAPIGGWSKKHDLAIWEPRIRQLERFGLPVEAVIQAHVPFVEPTLPTPAQVRNQFWWAASGGARGFLFEAAYLFTHISVRGLLTWDLQPQPDGRFDEIRRLAAIARQMEPVLAETSPATEGEAAAVGLTVESDGKVALRVRRGRGGEIYLLLINRAIDTTVRTRLLSRQACRIRELAPRDGPATAKRASFEVELAAGGGACFQILDLSP